MMKIISLENPAPVIRPLWTPARAAWKKTKNRALQLLDRLMDRPGVDVEAFKRVADICDEEEGCHRPSSARSWRRISG
jgi:hypothetical protein